MQTTDIDLHSTYIKKVQKSPKNWENVGRCTSYPYFTHARKKVKIFFYIERYGNDLHRPTSFLFSSPGGKKLLPHETETSTIIVVCQSASCTSFLFYFCWFCPRSKSDRHRLSRKKCKKARKLGRKDGSAEKETRKKFLDFWERFVFDLHRPTFDLHQKDAKKPEKLGECRCMNLIFLPYAREKKSNFFST